VSHDILIVIAADPITQFFVLLVGWVSKSIQQIVKASDASTILSPRRL